MKAEKHAVPVMLNVWTHDVSDTVYKQYFETGVFSCCVDSLLANGRGRVECLPEDVLKAGTGLGAGEQSNMVMGMNMSSKGRSSMGMSTMGMSMDDSKTKNMAMRGMSMSGSLSGSMMDPMSGAMSTTQMVMGPSSPTMTSMPTMTPGSSDVSFMSGSIMSSMSSMSTDSGAMSPMPTTLNPKGCTSPTMASPGYNLSSLPPQAYPNTTSPLLKITANYTLGWLSLHLVNSGAVSKLAVSLDGHSMFVYAADGLYTETQEVNVSCFPLTHK